MIYNKTSPRTAELGLNHAIESLIENRTTTGRFDPTRTLPEGVIEKLIHLATRAPSAFNLQNWRFIAVETPDAKARLKTVAFGQQQVADAAVTFIICGQVQAQRHLFDRLQPAVDRGILPVGVQRGWSDMAIGAHEANPQLQRDEAFRSASLAAMVIMLAADGMGLASGALSGFDPQALSVEFALGAHDVPVMLVTVGYPVAGNWPQKPRRPVVEVLERA